MSEVALPRVTSSRISSTWCVLSTVRLKKQQQNFKIRRGIPDTWVIIRRRHPQQASTVVSLVIRGGVTPPGRILVQSTLPYRPHRFRPRWGLQRKRRCRPCRQVGIWRSVFRRISLTSTTHISRCSRRWFTGAEELGDILHMRLGVSAFVNTL